jgi:hypothetical protein
MSTIKTICKNNRYSWLDLRRDDSYPQRKNPDEDRDLGGYRSGPGVIAVENDVLITAMFLGAGLLASVMIPGLLVMWDRVLDHRGSTREIQGK